MERKSTPTKYESQAKERIIALIDEFCNGSQQQLADKTGVNKASISQYVNGKNVPSNLTAKKLCAPFNINPAWIMGFDVPKQEYIEQNEDLSRYGIRPIKPFRLPVLASVSCGELKYAAEDIDGYVDADASFTADFCLIADGDSMINTGIDTGTIVFIRKQDTLENGEIGVVLYEDDATLKRVFYYPEQNMLILRPENPKYKDMVFTDSQLNEIRILGKAVYFQKKVE